MAPRLLVAVATALITFSTRPVQPESELPCAQLGGTAPCQMTVIMPRMTTVLIGIIKLGRGSKLPWERYIAANVNRAGGGGGR